MKNENPNLLASGLTLKGMICYSKLYMCARNAYLVGGALWFMSSKMNSEFTEAQAPRFSLTSEPQVCLDQVKVYLVQCREIFQCVNVSATEPGSSVSRSHVAGRKSNSRRLPSDLYMDTIVHVIPSIP